MKGLRGSDNGGVNGGGPGPGGAGPQLVALARGREESPPGPCAAAQSVPTPSGVRSINGYSIEVTWDEPVVARGVIEKYILRAYSEDAPGPPRMPSASSELVDTNTFTGKAGSSRE